MLKDFMHALFKEDVEEEDIEETAEEKEQPPKRVITQTEFEEIKEQTPVREPEPVYTPEPEPTPAAPAAPRQSIFTGLDMEDISRPAPKANRQSGYKFDRSRLNSKKNSAPADDYQAVISPIFGNVEDDKKDYDKIHDAVKLPKPESDFSMTKVISPMYGDDLPQAAPAKSIPAYRKKNAPTVGVKDLLDDNAKPKTEEEHK